MINRYETFVKRFSDLRNQLENFIEEVNNGKDTDEIIGFLDKLLIELIEVINIEKRFISQGQNNEYEDRVNEHIEILSHLVSIIEIDNINTATWKTSLNEMVTKIIKYQCMYEKKGIRCQTLPSEYSEFFGCMIYVICEYGLFIKLYGVTDEKLLMAMEARAEIHKEALNYRKVGWGEIVDVRQWHLMTQPSMERAKNNTNMSTKKNKKFTYYITGEPGINSFIAGQIMDDAQHQTYSSKNFVEIIREMNRKELKLGEIVAIDWVGNLSFINK